MLKTVVITIANLNSLLKDKDFSRVMRNGLTEILNDEERRCCSFSLSLSVKRVT